MCQSVVRDDKALFVHLSVWNIFAFAKLSVTWVESFICHDDVIKKKHFPRYWPFVWGIHRSPVNSPHKGQWAELWCFLWSAPIKRLSKHSRGWWFETLSRPLWRHFNVWHVSSQRHPSNIDNRYLQSLKHAENKGRGEINVSPHRELQGVTYLFTGFRIRLFRNTRDFTMSCPNGYCHSLKTDSRHDAKFVVTGDNSGCRPDNLRCDINDRVGTMATIAFQCRLRWCPFDSGVSDILVM